MSWNTQSPKRPPTSSSHPACPSQAGRKGTCPLQDSVLYFAWAGSTQALLCRNLLFMRLQSCGQAEHCLLLLHSATTKTPQLHAQAQPLQELGCPHTT